MTTSTAGTAGTAATAAAERVSVLGIRHHGPGSARSVLAELDRVRPEAVLIEGPADADPLAAMVTADGMEPPVALLAYAPDAPQRSAFWPFAVFSPEWQALRWAAVHDVPVRFCDLPAAAVLAHRDEPAAERPPDAVRGDPIAQLAAAAGYDDPERWWDDVVESRVETDGVPSPFPALVEAMAELRATGPDPDAWEERREAQMRQTLRAALKACDGPVAVVCGAWHGPALDGPLPPAAADVRTLRGLPKRRATLTWIPWTYGRLSFRSGYGAGIDSPGWYHHLFTAPDRPVTRWLTAVAGVLRARDLPVSSAHVIEAVRLAEALATLRSRPLAGLAEVSDATLAVLCDGDRVPLAYVTADLVLGERLGGVPPDAPAVPLEVDLVATARRLRLRRDPAGRTLTLDLRRDTDRARSVLLHRLATLGVDWGTPADDEVASTGTFRETWDLRWRPELAVDVVDAARYGTTVAAAATTRLTGRAAAAPDLRGVSAVVEQVLLADVPDALPDALAALDARAAADLDVSHLMAALPSLVRAQRYGDVRGTGTAALTAVADALLARVCAGLPAATGGLADDAARVLRRHLDAVDAALALRGDPAGRERWLATLRGLVDRRDLHGLLGGRLVRVLLDAGELPVADAARRFAAQLSVGTPVAHQAAWVEGLLDGSGLLLVHDRALLGVLDGWVTELADDAFTQTLPLLRRTFGDFAAPERAELARAVRRRGGPGAGEAADPGDRLDEERAGPAVAAVARILAGSASRAGSGERRDG